MLWNKLLLFLLYPFSGIIKSVDRNCLFVVEHQPDYRHSVDGNQKQFNYDSSNAPSIEVVYKPKKRAHNQNQSHFNSLQIKEAQCDDDSGEYGED